MVKKKPTVPRKPVQRWRCHAWIERESGDVVEDVLGPVTKIAADTEQQRLTHIGIRSLVVEDPEEVWVNYGKQKPVV